MIPGNDHHRTVAAISAVAILLIAGAGVMLTPQMDENDSDAVLSTGAAFGLGFVVGFTAGFGSGYAFAQWQYSQQVEELNRESSADTLYSNLNGGIAYYNHALRTYSNVWLLTSEHWVRQAELSATSLWDPEADYDAMAVLENAMVFQNSVLMMVNGTVQVNSHFNDALVEYVRDWENPAYNGIFSDGKMVLRFTAGTNSIDITGKDDWNARLGLLARDVGPGEDLVYFAGGQIYVSEDTTITNTSKDVRIPLTKGWNTVGDPEMMDDDAVYRLGHGVTYLGNFYPVFGEATSLKAGFVVTKGDGSSMVLNYEQRGGTDYVYDGSGLQSTFTVDIVPRETFNGHSQDLMSILRNYDALLGSTWDVLEDAEQSAGALWDIFDDAGQASAYLTTLSVPETYNNVRLNDAQRNLVTIMAMKQLSDYWQENSGDLKSTDYRMTDDSLTLYCHGDILVKGANVDGYGTGEIIRNVIYTPVFYTDHTLVKGGTTKVVRYAYALVWADASTTSLQSFDSTTFDDAYLVFLDAGSELYVKDMRYTGPDGGTTYPSSLSLDARNMDFIDPEMIVLPEKTGTFRSNDMAQLLMVTFVTLGALMVGNAGRKGSVPSLVVGVVLLSAGMFMTESFASALYRFGVCFTWPGL